MSPAIADERLQILLSEKEQADRQIGSYLGLQLKLMAVLFSAGVVAVGWLLGQFDHAPTWLLPTCLLMILFIGCFAIMQSVIMYGIVLGYIRYKHHVIGEEMRSLLGLDENPLRAFSAIGASRSNTIVMATSFVLGGLVVLGCAVLLVAAWMTGCALGWLMVLALGGGTILFLAAALSFIALGLSAASLSREIA